MKEFLVILNISCLKLIKHDVSHTNAVEFINKQFINADSPVNTYIYIFFN